MNTIIIDKENALTSFQKLMKLVSSGKKLEVTVKESVPKINIEKSYKQAMKDYKNGDFIYLGGKV